MVLHFFFQILLGGSQHKLDTINLVNFTGAWIIIDGNDVGLRIFSSQLFDYAFANHMIRETGKWLCADDV